MVLWHCAESPSRNQSMDLDRNQEKVRIGIVGLGRVAMATHIPVLKQLDDVEITACVETNKDRVARVKETLSLFHVFQDYHEMYRSKIVDAVYMCVPPHIHYDATISALKNGIHVLCEKPMGMSLREAIEMTSLAKDKNLVLMPGFKYRYSETIRQGREMIQSGLLGRILQIDGTFVTPGPYISWDPKSEWYLEEEQGGVLYDIGVHIIELINSLFPSPITRICANASFGYHEYNIPTNISCSFNMGSEIIGTLAFGWRLSTDLINISVHGTAGTVTVGLKGLDYYNAGTDPKDRILGHLKSASYELRTVINRIFTIFRGAEVSINDLEQAKAFVRAVRREVPPSVTGKEGVYVHNLLEAIKRSIKTGNYEEIQNI